MPFFFILPLWLLCILCGIVLLISSRWRFLSTYLLIGSTGAVLVSFLLSFALLFGAAKLLGGTSAAWVAIVAYLGGILLGGAVGSIGGMLLAQAVNRRLGWRSQMLKD